MKHCLVLAPFLLSSAAAFTAVNQQFQSFVAAPSSSSSSALKVSNFDYHGSSERIQEAYKAWCRVYNKPTDSSRLEIFAYHFLLAEKFFGQTGTPIKLNEFADMTSAEYLALQETGSLPQVPRPTEVIVSETKASDFALPEPVAPANYGPSAASYLDTLSSAYQATNSLSGKGMTSYLDTVSSTTTPTLGGAGMTSYLDSVSKAAPLSMDYGTTTTPKPAAPAPAPYVPPTPVAAAPAAPAPSKPAASTGNYMDALSASSSSTTPKGKGLTSYLDSVATKGAIRGKGMTSYLDSVSSTISTYSPFEAPKAATAPIIPPPPPAAVQQPIIPPPQPAQPYVPAPSNTVKAASGNYMDNLSASTSSTTRGAGISSYLDSVSSNGAGLRQGGTGMTSYLDNMVYVPPPPPEPVQEAIAPMVVPPRQPSYQSPRPSGNLPGAHWMDTVTPISSYGSHGINGNWDEANYQAANDRYLRRQAARRYQQVQAQAYQSPLESTTAHPGQQFQPQQSYKQEEQESIKPLAERVQRRQQRQIETFGGGFIIS